jgi:hypothetical protein
MAIRQTSRRWHWPERSDKSLEYMARMFNLIVLGWITYYGRYYKSAMYPTLKCLGRRLVMWQQGNINVCVDIGGGRNTGWTVLRKNSLFVCPLETAPRTCSG